MRGPRAPYVPCRTVVSPVLEDFRLEEAKSFSMLPLRETAEISKFDCAGRVMSILPDSSAMRRSS